MSDAIVVELLSTVNSMRRDLADHMDGEEEVIKGINAKVDNLQEDLTAWRLAAERRHTALIQSLESWTAKVDCSDAFITTPDGKKDLQGHKDDHLTRLQFDDWTRRVKQEVIMNTAKVGTLGILTWIMYVLWEAFVKGPK